MIERYEFLTIGEVRSCYKEKFGVPRQPGLVRVPATIDIHADYAKDEAFRGLEAFSHIWVLFIFHRALREEWKPTVRPPRLGGNERVGVFASRSMFRPNPIGLSVVELAAIRRAGAGIQLDIIGGDLIDGTPVVDIKPYLPYVDAVADAKGGYAPVAPPKKMNVRFTPEALAVIRSYQDRLPDLEQTLREILQYDPRPSYQVQSGAVKTEYGMRVFDFDLKWCVQQDEIVVRSLDR